MELCPRHGVATALAALLVVSGEAHARRTGIAAPGCQGCHSAIGAKAIISANPASFMPGADVTFQVAISGGASASVGGLYVARPTVGELYSIAGEGLNLTVDGLLHSQPKAMVSGVTTFRFGWRAPATPAGLNLDIYVLAGNGDGRSTGDVAGETAFHAVFGCTSQDFYFDGDGDQYGDDTYAVVVGCTGQSLQGYSATPGDCNGNDARVYPGATEVCNTRDDDCDGAIDEGATPTELYPDEDGDGFYSRSAGMGTPVIGCAPMRGYADRGGDCVASDPKIFPGALEICNLLDDNCDGRVDERLRPQCGIGFCVRDSITCDEANCTPGVPVPETCNLLDDDCDGEVDEAPACPLGQLCTLGRCGAAGASSIGGSATSSGGASAAGSGAAQGGASFAGATALGGATGAGSGGLLVSGGSPSSTPTESSGCSSSATRPRGQLAALVATLALAWAAQRRRRQRPLDCRLRSARGK